MELGSEYSLSFSELTVQKDSIFEYVSEYGTVFRFDSGRSALKYIALHLKGDDQVLLPEFICESVADCFPAEQTRYYSLQPDFTVNTDDLGNKISPETRLILVMHYFGAVQPREKLTEIRRLADLHDCVIVEDTTHSIFSQSATIGDYMVCSIRKWLPIPRGGLLYYAGTGENPLGTAPPRYPKSTDNRRANGMVLKDMFLREGLPYNADYRRIFAESEHLIDTQTDIRMMSDFAEFIASCVSTGRLKSRRRKNYDRLRDALSRHGLPPALSLGDCEIPLVFPLRVPNRDAFRSYLMDNRIYCAVHWPFDGVQPDARGFALKNAEELISLPIDQRYDERHMEYLAKVILQYEGDLLF
ncbi:MAG: DegT/DnrJ/EryC1/StrS family aminotransferase [Clostridia bacterium]|nr:DegT/DnrJ/EryC1/StrS family aminotransferase [Clostridia bacterium]